MARRVEGHLEKRGFKIVRRFRNERFQEQGCIISLLFAGKHRMDPGCRAMNADTVQSDNDWTQRRYNNPATLLNRNIRRGDV
jgi:hypothetical protein